MNKLTNEQRVALSLHGAVIMKSVAELIGCGDVMVAKLVVKDISEKLMAAHKKVQEYGLIQEQRK